MSAAVLTTSIGADREPPAWGKARRRASKSKGRLDALLARLETEGFAFDVRQRAAAHRILIAWHAEPELGDLTDLLAPIFARTADQQARFRKIAEDALPAASAVLLDPESTVELKAGLAGRITKRSRFLRLAVPTLVIGLAWLTYAFWPRDDIAPAADNQPPARPSMTEQLADVVEQQREVTFEEHFVIATNERKPIQRWLFWAPLALFLIWLIGWRMLPAWKWLSEEEDSAEGDPGWLPLPGKLRRHLLAGLNKGDAAADWQIGRYELTGDLDVERTIGATVREGGALAPVYQRRCFDTETLFMIERHGPFDHVAALFDLVVRRLRDEGVLIERFFYRDDPRFLQAPEDGRTLRLNEVISRYPECRLAVIATADGFFHPLTGEPESWLADLTDLTPRVLLNTRALEEWGWREMDLFERGFSLAIANSDGLALTGAKLGREYDQTPAMLGVTRLPESEVSGGNVEDIDGGGADLPPPIPTPDTGPLRVFVTYVERDYQGSRYLRSALETFDHERLFRVQVSEMAKAALGDNVWVALQQDAADADVVVIMVSAEALASGWLDQGISQAISDTKAVVPILLDDCDWQSSSLASFRCLPADGRSLKSLKDDPAAWRDIAWDLRGIAISRRAVMFKDVDEPWCPKMAVIPPGSFMMGSPEGQGNRDEHPQHEVMIGERFALGRYPITFEEFDYFCEETGREKPEDYDWGRSSRPAVGVSWEDATAYADWLSETTGEAYKLPSEAQWEYACRAGTTTRYAFGDEIVETMANFGNNIGKTTEVGAYPANAFGLRDMHGNVWEWVEDHWHGNYDGAPQDGSPWLEGNDSMRVLRGGAWSNYPDYLRAAYRFRLEPDYRYYNVGFRLSRTLTP